MTAHENDRQMDAGNSWTGHQMMGDGSQELQIHVVPLTESRSLHPFDPANAVANTTAACTLDGCGKIVPYPYMVADAYHALCTEEHYHRKMSQLTAGQPMPEMTEAGLRLIQITDEKRGRALRNRAHYHRARQEDDQLRARLGLPFLDEETNRKNTSPHRPELVAA